VLTGEKPVKDGRRDENQKLGESNTIITTTRIVGGLSSDVPGCSIAILADVACELSA
jgi:hypothetical protein